MKALSMLSRPRRINQFLKTSSRISITSIRTASFGPQPSPPRLPKEEQQIFEELLAKSTGAFSTPRQAPSNTSSISQIQSTAQSDLSASQQISQAQQPSEEEVQALNARIKAAGSGEELHPHIRRGAKPEFEGDTNPKTGEVGGPKNEPLRWGAGGDYSYNGRVTDF